MKPIIFTIRGNHENPLTGNPIPYTRQTQRSTWTDKARRYQAWKTYVVANYLDTVAPRNKPFNKADYGEVHDLLGKKPIKKGVRGRIEARIFFSDETHADPDNIVKGILDSLFQDDKHIDVTTTHLCHQLAPRVEITLTIYE